MREPYAEITLQPGAGLLQDSANTGERVLESAYDAYARMLYRYALAISGSPDDAEDSVQEVFAKVARDWKRVSRMDNPKAYLFSATRNAAYSILRSKRRRDTLHDSVCAEMVSGAGSDLSEAAHAKMLCEALIGLPIDQREVLTLKVFDGMTFKEITETIGVSMGTVTSRYKYGIEKLRKALEETDDER